MRHLLGLALVLVLAGALPASAGAHELGPARPPKTAAAHVAPPPDPAVLRQGGDTILDAVELILPIYEIITGTTVGYTDDYDEVCPYSGSTSPDVVYTFLQAYESVADIDMFGSSYDTKIYVYDENLELIACNDDFYSDYVSKLESVFLSAGVRYYLVIDGWGGDAGDYELRIDLWNIEVLECPSGAVLEAEPPLATDYVDEYNGGCNTPDAPGGPPFQHLASAIFCGVSGWYTFGDTTYRDTDWFTVTLPPGGTLTVGGEAERFCYLFELGPQDCGQVAVLQSVEIGLFVYEELILVGEAGSEVWIWVGPSSFDNPNDPNPFEFDYILWLDNPVATERHSWSEVKALFD